MASKLKIMDNEKHPIDVFKKDEITEIREKIEMHKVGPGIWRGKLKITENEKNTLQEVKYGEDN